MQGSRATIMPAAAGKPEALPPKIGRYVVQRRIGAGAMGIVYQAHDPDLDRDVAVKVLPTEYGRDEECLKRFLREARLAAKLHHTNTVGVYEVNAQDDLAYLAMELVDGESLDKLASPRRPMRWRDATRAICDAAAGLAAAHDIGLIHRDVKPANLMRTRKGVTKVVDFGLARALTTSTQLTQHGLVMGTPAYMPPEQWVGQELDARSDLYALACSYYQLLTGRLPFDASSSAALGYQHRHEPLPDPRKLVPHLPDGVCRVLAKGAQKEPKDRYQNANDLVAELEAILASPEDSLTFRTPWHELGASSATSGSAHRSLTRGMAEPARRWAEAILGPSTGGAWRRRCVIIAAAAAAAALWLGVVLYLTTNHGSVKIELLEPEAIAEVKIDGDAVEIRTLDEPIRVKVGQHELNVRSKSLQTFTKSFTLRRGDRETVRVTFETSSLVSRQEPPVPPAQPGPVSAPSVPPPDQTAGRIAAPSPPAFGAAQAPPPPSQTFGSPFIPPPASQRDVASVPSLPISPSGVSAEGPTISLYSPSDATAAPVGSMDDLPRLAEVAASWSQTVGSRVARFRSRRDEALAGLPEHDCSSLLPMPNQPGGYFPGGPPGPQRNEQLPTKFVLVGNLAAVRADQDKSYVYLVGRSLGSDHDSQRYLSESMQFYSSPMSPVPLIAVEFANTSLATWMADYCVGDRVHGVVRRQSWGGPPQGYFRGDPSMMPPGARQHLDEFRPLVTERSMGPLRMCWCFAGEGIEKANLPDTWVDPSLGRVAQLTNPQQLARSPGFLARNGDGSRGVAGVLNAKFSSLSSSEDGVIVKLAVDSPLQGRVQFSAKFAPPVRITEFLDYQPGCNVEVAGTVAGRFDEQESRTSPNRTPPSLRAGRLRSAGRSYPQSAGMPPDGMPPSLRTSVLRWGGGMALNCSQIRVEGKPHTLISVSGARRTNVAVTAITPDVAHADAQSTLGREVTWSGTLYRLRWQRGHAQLVVSLTGSLTGLRYFEAYSKDRQLFDDLVDYVDQESATAADRVSVSGIVAAPDAVAPRLQTGSPLVQIRQVERVDDPKSVVVVGRTRDSATLRKESVRTGLSVLFRDRPAAGTDVTFTARFERYDENSRSVHVTSDGSRDRVEISFPRSNASMFVDYRRGDELQTRSVVAIQEDLKLVGKAIRRTANPNSLVTDTGRPVAAMDVSIYRERWQKIRSSLEQHVGERLTGCGKHSGYTTGYSRGQRVVNFLVENLYLEEYSGSKISLEAPFQETARQFLQSLKEGDEVVFEFTVGEGSSYSKVWGRLLWISKISDPENKVEFSSPKTE